MKTKPIKTEKNHDPHDGIPYHYTVKPAKTELLENGEIFLFSQAFMRTATLASVKTKPNQKRNPILYGKFWWPPTDGIPHYYKVKPVKMELLMAGEIFCFN